MSSRLHPLCSSPQPRWTILTEGSSSPQPSSSQPRWRSSQRKKLLTHTLSTEMTCSQSTREPQDLSQEPQTASLRALDPSAPKSRRMRAPRRSMTMPSKASRTPVTRPSLRHAKERLQPSTPCWTKESPESRTRWLVTEATYQVSTSLPGWATWLPPESESELSETLIPTPTVINKNLT